MTRFAPIFAAVVLLANLVLGQGANPGEIVPGDNLVVDGIPKIPASLAETVNRYKNSYGYPLAGWDLTKRELWLKVLASTGTWLSRVEKPGAIPMSLISIPVGGVYDVYCQPQGKYLVYNKDAAGNELFQFYLYDIATRESKLLTDGKSRNTEPVWSNAGDRIIHSSSPPNGDGVDLSIINPFQPGKNRLLAEGRGHYLKAYDWSPDDRKAIICDFASNTVSTLWLIDTTTGEKTLLSPKAESKGAFYDTPQFCKSGKGVYVITDRGSEYRRLVYLDFASRQARYLSDHIKWDVEEFRLSPDGKTVAFITNEDGVSRLHLLDNATGKEKTLSTLPVGIISDLKWHNNSVDVAFNLKSPAAPNDVYSIDTNTGKIERWSKSVTGEVDLAKLPKPEVIRWRSFDGRMISALVSRPPATFTGRRPVIVDIHGGPEDQYRPGFNYDANYFLNELGIVHIFPNVRGSTGYGKTFLNADNGLLRRDTIKDIGGLLDWIKKQPDLDADRVMVQGVSHGGYMALSVAVQYGDRIRAALSDSGPSNLVPFLENTAVWRRDLRRQEYGDERDPRIKEFLQKTAPINNIEHIKKPLMLVHGQNDVRVPAEEASRLVTALKKRGIPVWYLLAKDEGHVWNKQRNLDYRSYSIALFVRENLIK